MSYNSFRVYYIFVVSVLEPLSCCNFAVFLIRYGLSIFLILFLLMRSLSSDTSFLCVVSLSPTHMRPRQRDSVASWYPVVHVPVASSGINVFGVSYPCSCVPSTEIQSMAGILQCTCLVLARFLPFWSSITHALCVPSTETQSLAGILQCTFSFPVQVLPFLEPRPLFSAFPCINNVCPAVK